MNELMLQAAQARAGGLNQQTQRPSQRRCAEQSESRAWARFPASLSLREPDPAGGTMTFHGIASATDTPYEMYDFFGPYTEVVSSEAFVDTLNRADLDVPLVLAHDQIRRIARTTTGTLRLSLTDEGLDVDADLDPADVDVAYIAPKIRAKLVDEMSFAFRIEAGIWSPDWTQYTITKLDLHRGDVAIVGFGANPYTSAELRTETQPVGYRQRAITLLDLAIATGGRN